MIGAKGLLPHLPHLERECKPTEEGAAFRRPLRVAFVQFENAGS